MRHLIFTWDVLFVQGYISHYIAKSHDINTIAVEANEKILEEGRKRAENIEYHVKKKEKRIAKKNENTDQEVTSSKITATVQFLAFSVSHDNLPTLQEKLNPLLMDSDLKEKRKFGIMGLHTCGNLAVMQVNYFLHLFRIH